MIADDALMQVTSVGHLYFSPVPHPIKESTVTIFAHMGQKEIFYGGNDFNDQ